MRIPFSRLALGLAVAAGLTPAAADAQSVDVSIPYGSTTACSGDPLCDGRGWMWPNDTTGWMGGIRSFTDPVPSGAVVTGVDAWTVGRCDDRSTGIAVNGNDLGTVQYTGTSCVCDSATCSMTNVVSGSWPGGMPGYVYGGSNEVSLPAHHDDYVLVSLELTIHYTVGCEGGSPDGTVSGSEQCDDGNGIDTDACTNDCLDAHCGDGIVWAGVEDCDEGSDNSDTEPDACRTTCEAAGCGDGVLDSGEECDEGSANSDTTPDACRTRCEAAFCGDDVVDTGEACDDGPSGSAFCLPTCTPAPDAGPAPTDAGTDAGSAGADSGIPGTDAGTPGADSGTPRIDGGGTGVDAGSPPARRGRRGGCGCVTVGAGPATPAAGPIALLVVALLWRWRWRRRPRAFGDPCGPAGSEGGAAPPAPGRRCPSVIRTESRR